MFSNGRHRVHTRLSDDLDRDGNVKVPHPHRFVVGRGDETPVLVNERDGVDRSKMLIILLHDLPRSHVVLCAMNDVSRISSGR